MEIALAAALLYLLLQHLLLQIDPSNKKLFNYIMSSSPSTSSPSLPAATTTPRPKILLLGDSLTQLGFEGWAATLANVYQRRADVLNRGYSGYTTKFYLHLPVERHDNVILTVLWFGANDAALMEQDPHHHVPLDDYKANLQQLVKQQRAIHPSTRVILMTPPPVHHGQRLHYQKQRYAERATGILERTLEHTGLYAQACRQVSAELNVPCVDLYSAMLESVENSSNEDHGIYLCDGLHLSKQGHDFVAQQLLAAIQTHYSDIHVTRDPKTGQWCNSNSSCPALTSQGPYHDEIDHKNVQAAFSK